MDWLPKNAPWFGELSDEENIALGEFSLLGASSRIGR
jgi:hypothetical protein